MSTTDTTPVVTTGGRRRLRVLASVAIAGVLVAAMVTQAAGAGKGRPPVPRDPAVETATGARIERATLAADTGLLDIRYVVLNPTKARRTIGDTSKPPRLESQRTHRVFDRVAEMRNAHELRGGQTYYVLYLNTAGNLKRGDAIDITFGGVTLHGVPIE